MPELISTATTSHNWRVEGTDRGGGTWTYPASDDYAQAAFSGISNIPANAEIREVEIVSTTTSERIYTLYIREGIGIGTPIAFTAENIKTLLQNGSRGIALFTKAHAGSNSGGTSYIRYTATAGARIKITYGDTTGRVKVYDSDASEWVLCETYICEDGTNWEACEIRYSDGNTWTQCNFT